MNQRLFLHVVERLEGLIGRLPAAIQKPILSELTPLKELFLEQRPPRLFFTGPGKKELAPTLSRILSQPIDLDLGEQVSVWAEVALPDRGMMSIFDGREGDSRQVEEELKRQPADVIFFLGDESAPPRRGKTDIDKLKSLLNWNDESGSTAKIAALSANERTRDALESDHEIKRRLLGFFDEDAPADTKKIVSILAHELPNQARIEMIRLSGDKEAQRQVAQFLVKSTAAICTAIGAQPIPLADMPILTTLQLVMVSGIMYVSGRDRSLRAATEFVGALGANLGAGMLLREGTRAILKFLPGWGNVISGMVAGAGTYAIGRAAEVFFIEGVSLKDARRTYLRNRKRVSRPELPGPTAPKKRLKGQKTRRR